MQVSILFSDERPIPLITPAALDVLITGVQNEIKRNEKVRKTLLPWFFHLEHSKKVHEVIAKIVKQILRQNDLNIVLFCGDAYGCITSFKDLVGEGETVKEKYTPLAIPYVERCRGRIHPTKEIVEGEARNLERIIKNENTRPDWFRKSAGIKHDSMYSWGTVPTAIALQGLAPFFDTPVVSSRILCEIFKYLWEEESFQQRVPIRPVVLAEGHTLRNMDGELPERWQPKPYVFANKTGYNSYLQDPHYYEAYFRLIVERLTQRSRFSIQHMHIYCTANVKPALEEALFFFRWDRVVSIQFSCAKTHVHLI